MQFNKNLETGNQQNVCFTSNGGVQIGILHGQIKLCNPLLYSLEEAWLNAFLKIEVCIFIDVESRKNPQVQFPVSLVFSELLHFFTRSMFSFRASNFVFIPNGYFHRNFYQKLSYFILFWKLFSLFMKNITAYFIYSPSLFLSFSPSFSLSLLQHLSKLIYLTRI